jgi:hypothetical protein
MTMLAAAIAIASEKLYEQPLISTVSDNARIYIYDSVNGSRNISGLDLKRETSAFAHLSTSRRIANANQIFTLMTTGTSTKLIKRPAPGASDYNRQMEIKNALGIIVMYIQATGKIVLGTPAPLTTTAVYPANGATNVSNGTWFNYSSTVGGYNYWSRHNKLTPTLSFNKGDAPNPTISPTGSSTWDNYGFSNFSGAAGTLYTMRFNRLAYVQTDGETSSSCGVMTVNGTYCDSTFRIK